MNEIIELLEITNLENDKLTKESISKLNQGNKMPPKKYTIDIANIDYNLSYADAKKVIRNVKECKNWYILRRSKTISYWEKYWLVCANSTRF